MLFNPTPLERLTSLTNQLIEKNAGSAGDLKTLQDEVATLRSALASKEDEIAQLKAELNEKDDEIEAVIAKIETLLG